MTTVPKNTLPNLISPPALSNKSTMSGKGRINAIPPPTMLGTEPQPTQTGEGPTEIAGVPLSQTK